MLAGKHAFFSSQINYKNEVGDETKSVSAPVMIRNNLKRKKKNRM